MVAVVPRSSLAWHSLLAGFVLSHPLLGPTDFLLPGRVILPREGERLCVIAIAQAANTPLLEAGGVAATRAWVVQVRMTIARNT